MENIDEDGIIEELGSQFKEFLERSDLGFAIAEKVESFLVDLDLGYVIQLFLERVKLEDYWVKESPHLFGGKSYSMMKKEKEPNKEMDIPKKEIPEELWDTIMETLENMDMTKDDEIITTANLNIIKKKLKKFGYKEF